MSDDNKSEPTKEADQKDSKGCDCGCGCDEVAPPKRR